MQAVSVSHSANRYRLYKGMNYGRQDNEIDVQSFVQFQSLDLVFSDYQATLLRIRTKQVSVYDPAKLWF